MDDLAAEFGTTFLGVTSAYVVVSNRRTFDAIASHPDVYLVDLSVEQVRRATGERDAVMNDVYWDLAGW